MKKRPTDPNQLAKSIVDEVTQESTEIPDDGKDPAAVSLGRRGGLKGGNARAAKLSPERRSEIARAAGNASWKKRKEAAEKKRKEEDKSQGE